MNSGLTPRPDLNLEQCCPWCPGKELNSFTAGQQPPIWAKMPRVLSQPVGRGPGSPGERGSSAACFWAPAQGSPSHRSLRSPGASRSPWGFAGVLALPPTDLPPLSLAGPTGPHGHRHLRHGILGLPHNRQRVPRPHLHHLGLEQAVLPDPAPGPPSASLCPLYQRVNGKQ